jgi:hypothetical protein
MSLEHEMSKWYFDGRAISGGDDGETFNFKVPAIVDDKGIAFPLTDAIVRAFCAASFLDRERLATNTKYGPGVASVENVGNDWVAIELAFAPEASGEATLLVVNASAVLEETDEES